MKGAVLVETFTPVAALEAILADCGGVYSHLAIASSVCEQLFDDTQLLKKGVQGEACESWFLSACSRLFFFLIRSFVEGWPAFFPRRYFFQQMSRDITFLPGRLMESCHQHPTLVAHVRGVRGCRDPLPCPTNACQQ